MDILTSVSLENRNTFVEIPIDIFTPQKQILNVPVFTDKQVPALNCSGYVRMAAQELFHKKYSVCDAWNRRYQDELIAPVHDFTLASLAQQGTLQQGMLVGLHYPDSEYNDTLDQEGRKTEYTHIGLYLGNNSQDEPLLAELFGDEVFIRTEPTLRNKHLTPKEIIDSRE